MLPGRCLDSTVKLFVTHTEPNFSLPWQMRHQNSSNSTGFYIGDHRILTNAHCVDNYAVVKLKKRGDSKKYVADVLAIGRECDLALLTVKDKEFWKGMEPIVLADALPSLQDEVTVVGFPVGGDNQSVTQGVISRIDMQEYVHGCCELLAVQIDAAINPGNSGGPAFGCFRGECVGIAFQSLKDGQTENIGYIIPTEVVQHFLKDVTERGRYCGFCELGMELQRCENPSLRARVGMSSKQQGLLVKQVYPTTAGAEGVRRGDVVTHFDGVPLANDGTVPFRAGERISFSYVLSHKHVGEKISLKLVRDGKPLPPLELTLRLSTLLVPVDSAQRKPGAQCPDLRVPSYAIVGGLVFVPLCEPYLRAEYGDDFDAKAPIKLLDKWQYGLREALDAQVIVMSQVLAHECNVGYEQLSNLLVSKVNGTPVRNLRHLVELVDANTEPFLSFDLEPHAEMLVIEARQLPKVTAEVLAHHNIARARSKDLDEPPPAANGEARPAGGKGKAGGGGPAGGKRRKP